MAIDPRTPVLIGVGQVTRHPTTVEDCPEPAALLEEAARLAGDDSGAQILHRADSVQVVQLMSHPYRNAALSLARRLGLTPRETVLSAVGGNSPQMLVNQAGLAIAAGRADVVLIAGAETIHSRHLAHATGGALPWPADPADITPPDRVIGTERPGTSDDEQARLLAMPVQIYPIFETAIRLNAGRTVAEQQALMGRLWAGFSATATGNPHAWDQRAHTADEIATASPQNRWIGWPYTKLMCAYAGVDMAAALILTSVGTARDAKVPTDRWVYLWSGADSHDHWFVTNRHDLGASPAMAANGRAAFTAAGIGADEVGHVDLYSCFPSAVQMGATALGMGLDRPLTVTGGLSFCGGPLNNYVTHSIASMVDVLRAQPGSIGLVTANGWYATKHSIGIYSTEPPLRPYSHTDAQPEVDRLPDRAGAPDHTGPVRAEAWSVMHERDGAPNLGLVACLTDDGRRTWGTTRDVDTLGALMTAEEAGPAELDPDGTVHLT